MDKFKLEIPYKDLIIDLDKSARYGYSVDTIIIPASNFYTQGNSELSKLSSQNIAINNELAKNFTQNAEEYLKQLDLELDDEVTKKKSKLRM